jgi:hypothetical protein
LESTESELIDALVDFRNRRQRITANPPDTTTHFFDFPNASLPTTSKSPPRASSFSEIACSVML